MPRRAGPHREAPVLVRRQKEKAWVTLLFWFSWEGMRKAC